MKKHMHGMRKTVEYSRWCGIIQRCTNPKQPGYARYGGRGITVCAEWRGSFVAFLRDVGHVPGPEYSIERIDNTKGYEPGNVRWATRIEQARNKRNNRIITVGDVTCTLAEWAERTGLPSTQIQERLVSGWTPEDAVGRPHDWGKAAQRRLPAEHVDEALAAVEGGEALASVARRFNVSPFAIHYWRKKRRGEAA